MLGVITICKLPGMSSHEVVARVRRIAGLKRVGHAGTLDPSACGVLPVCLGPATRLADYLVGEPKVYRAEFLLGVATDSYDAEGDVTARADASHLTDATVAAVLPRFTGVLHQRPPAHSAVFINGVRAYQLTRQGQEVAMPLREVTVHAFTPVRVIPGAVARLLADITCSGGTYIRSLARDIGEALGVGGTLGFLARTRVGDYRLEDAVTPDELARAAEDGRLSDHLIPADRAVAYLPAVHLPEEEIRYLEGKFVSVDAAEGIYRVYLGARFAGIGQVKEGQVRPVVNLKAS
ncbi:MAG TPA: tRNA pseudouridine(55) synthase TruB [Armatimonadota bacterium]|nr:tRNA pseudouridine(55) synthase TruB [Armatimonadota bacterium]HOS44427.1 tRNA pseudouridine(55) synthase TruB [Armatimonadota bacterium]